MSHEEKCPMSQLLLSKVSKFDKSLKKCLMTKNVPWIDGYSIYFLNSNSFSNVMSHGEKCHMSQLLLCRVSKLEESL